MHLGNRFRWFALAQVLATWIYTLYRNNVVTRLVTLPICYICSCEISILDSRGNKPCGVSFHTYTIVQETLWNKAMLLRQRNCLVAWASLPQTLAMTNAAEGYRYMHKIALTMMRAGHMGLKFFSGVIRVLPISRAAQSARIGETCRGIARGRRGLWGLPSCTTLPLAVRGQSACQLKLPSSQMSLSVFPLACLEYIACKLWKDRARSLLQASVILWWSYLQAVETGHIRVCSNDSASFCIGYKKG